MLGICNGFQVLCEAGLLPGALLPNESVKFLCRQVDLESSRSRRAAGPRPASPATSSRSRSSTSTGRYFAPPEMLDSLEASGQVVLRYAPGQNPNGCARDIAGVRNEAGNVIGLMPHPEHAVDPLTGSADGLKLFESVAVPAAA